MKKISIEKMAGLIKNYWAPLDLFQINNVKVRLVKLKGKYHWHKHIHEDELFYVLNGKMTIHLKEKNINLEQGEGFVVEKGIEHQTEACEEALVMLVEPSSIITKGD